MNNDDDYNVSENLKTEQLLSQVTKYHMATSHAHQEKTSTQIVFFDLETTVPHKPGERFWILEFGAIVVCPQKLVELESYCTLIRPNDLSMVATSSSREDGITRKAVKNAPCFEDVADRIFSILHGKIWAGHNIQRFDCVRLKEAFAEIGRPCPVPVAMIDSLGVLTEKFGRRAGNMKMATLANYFGLGQQKHRSLDDVRMNLEVLKHCATVLFLESSIPSAIQNKWYATPSVTTRSRSTLKLPCRDQSTRKISTISLGCHKPVPYITRGSLSKMTEKVRSIAINSLLKHSHALLR
ncbi:Exonuclease, RNase T/DNA polymerase III [Dillenia turbinata]|uniref:Exonuclease, RNase T/DNA polymerase III n=1 Tax=Dillenia turbinata TaxID=194707 RepID=A0AAN8UW13_9MAGN